MNGAEEWAEPFEPNRVSPADALRAFRDAGFVVLRDVIRRPLVDQMLELVTSATQSLLEAIGGIDGLATQACGPHRLGAMLALEEPFA